MKLLVSFAILLVISIIIGGVGIFGMMDLNRSASDIYDFNLIPISAIGTLLDQFEQQRLNLREIFLCKDDMARVNEIIEEIKASDVIADEHFGIYEAGINNPDNEKAYYTAKDAWKGAFADLKTQIFSFIAAGDFDSAYTVFRDPVIRAASIDPVLRGFEESMNFHESEANDKNLSTDKLFLNLLIIIIAIVAVGAAASVILGIYISGLISKPLIPLSAFMSKASKTGDLTLSAEDIQVINKAAESKDEIGQTVSACSAFVGRITEVSTILGDVASGDLTHDINALSESDTMGNALHNLFLNLNSMFTDIHASADQVSTGSNQVADGAQSLAQGSTEQAASIEELSSSISEIAQKTKENAEIASKTSRLSENIKESAEKGSRQMDEMMTAVGEITEASRNISKIIKTIDDIAFQTNILALNAAVEAARAGQHGKGFAVVAEEVRSLATKSAEAAKDTDTMIQNSIEKADLGANIANETAASLTEIVTGINESGVLIGEIASSSEEQSMGIAQINIGIDQVAQVVQQNSATAEQSAAAAEEMSAQATTLQELISQFRLSDEKQQSHQPKPVVSRRASEDNFNNSYQNSDFNDYGGDKY